MKSLRLTLFLFLVLTTLSSIAADRYWIATTGSNWNNVANWSTSSGGTGGASVPGFTDRVFFDANSTGVCTLDVNASIDAMIMSNGTLNTSTFTFTVSGTSSSTFSGGTVNGNNVFNIQPTGTAIVTFSGTIFNPEVDVVAPRIRLSGSTFNGVSSFEKTGASNDAGTGGNSFVGNCTIKNSGSGYFLLGNGNDDSFTNDLDIINSGSHYIYLAYNNSTTSIGGNLTISNTGSALGVYSAQTSTSTINVTGNCIITNNSTASSNIYFANSGSFTIGGTLDITNNGTANSTISIANGSSSSGTITGATTVTNNNTATTHRIYLGNQGDITFDGTLYIKNNSDATNSQIYCNTGTSSANTYNENIKVEVTVAGSDGILFGAGGGSGTLASGKTITIGSNGYISGDLEFRNFTQTGATNHTFVLTGTARFYSYDSNWGGDLDAKAPRMVTRGTTYNGLCKLEKTGVGSDQSAGGNTFTDNTEIINTGSNYFMMGNGTGDDFQGNLTLTNNGTNNFYLAYNSSTITNIDGNLTINNISASSNGTVYISFASTSIVEVTGTTTVTNSGAGTTKQIYLGYNGDITFNNNLTIHNSSTATNSRVYLNNGGDSHNEYKGNIVVESSGTNSDGVLFGASGGTGTLAATKTITIGSAGFKAGDLEFRNFTQTGATNHTFVLTGTARFYNYDSNWGGDLDAKAPQMITRGTTYNGICKLEKTGVGSDQSAGGNTFTDNTEIINTGSNYFIMGNGTSDDFQGNLTLTNNGSHNIYIAYNSSTTTNIDGNLVINNTSATSNGSVYISVASASDVVITGTTTVNNSGAGTTKRIYLGDNGDITFNNDLTIYNSSTATNSQVYLNNRTDSHNDYNGNIVVESSDANSDGVLFGASDGTGTLAATKTITIGGAGFIAGDLQFRNFTQTGATGHTFELTGTARFYSYNSNWGGNLDVKAPRMITRGTTYNGTVFLKKTGSGHDYSAGGNIFKANTEIVNNGSGYLFMGNGASDDFQTNLIIRNTGTSNFYLANNSAGNQIAGDLNIYNSGVYVYLNNNASSTTTIGGNCTVSQTGSLANSRVYLNDDGTLSIGGTLDITTSTSGNAYVSVSQTSTSSTTITGNTTVTNSGTGTTSVIYLGNAGDITFNGTLTIHNNSASANSQVYLNNAINTTYTSHNNYNENIIVESTVAGCDGVLFGYSGGNGTLASGKTITIGSKFISGQLYLRNFTQTGTTPQTLTTTVTANIYNYNSNWGGNVVFTSPALLTRGTTYQGTAFFEKTGSSNDNGLGGNTFTGNVTFKNSGTGSLTLGNGTQDVASSNVTLENVGSNDIFYARSGAGHTIGGNFIINNTGSDGDIYVAYGTGSTLSIAGNTTVVNTGAGSYHRVYLGYVGSITFTGTLDISNSSTATNSAIYLNNSTGSNNTYAQNITIENTDAASDGVLFGIYGGTGVLADTKTISIKAGGFKAGQLYLRNFTQNGGTAQTLSATIDGDLTIRDCEWGGNVTFDSPRMHVYGSTFHGTAFIEKTGAGNDNSAGGNIFMNNVEFKNSGSGYLFFGSGSSSSFQANVTLTNTGTNNIIFARSGTGHSIVGDLDISNTSTGGQVIIADQSTSSLVIGGKTTVTNSGSGTYHRVYLGNDGDVTFGGDIDVSNSSDATYNEIYIGDHLTYSQVALNGNLLVENTNTASDGVIIHAQSAIMATGKTISLKAGGFVAGTLQFENFTQLGTTVVNLTLTGTARLRSINSNWGGEVKFNAPRLNTRNSIFNGITTLEKTGAGDDQCLGGNTFEENVTVTNSSLGSYLMIATSVADTYKKDLVIKNTGDDDIYLGYVSAGTEVKGDLSIQNSARNFYIAYGSASSVSVTGNTSIVNNSSQPSANTYIGIHGDVTITGDCDLFNTATGASGQITLASGSDAHVTTGALTANNENAGTTKRIYIGNGGITTVNGAFTIKNISTATNSQVYCNPGSTSVGTYNGNISITSTGTNCDGVYFGSGGGSATLSAGHTISATSGNFTDGTLYLRNFTQSGALSQTLALTSSAYLYMYNTNWNGVVDFTAPRIYTRQSTFNNNVTLEKTGSVGISSYGGNTFNGTTSIENSSTSYYYLASYMANDYNGDVIFTKSGSGIFYPAYNHQSTLAGNLSINTNGTFTIGYAGGGWLEFDGTAAQSISNTGAANQITIRRLMTNNTTADITLNTPITIDRNINLTNGNLITTAANILTMTDNSVVDAVSDNAYVAGPMKKIGNDSFKFPVGGTDSYGDSHYAAIGISAPSGTTHSFTAQYHAAGHSNAATFSSPLTKVSLVEYWDLERTVGSGSINVYLYWTNGTRSGIGSLTDLRVAHWDGSTWEDKGNNGTSGTIADGGIAANGISTFSPFTFGTVDNIANPLPIDLLSFDVNKEDESVRVDWSTASETNNDYFIVERTDDFNNIEVVQIVKGAGNSNKVLNYFIYDNKPLNGTSYYRLTQVDFDGQKEVFDWKSVNFNQTREPLLSVFPNPSNTGEVNIKLTNMEGATELEIYDISGRLIHAESLELVNSNTIMPLNAILSPGVYFIHTINNNITLTQRLIVK